MTEARERRNRARALRRRATDAERELWRQLRVRLPVEGSYFRRQVPIGPYFVDFVCLRHRLVIELDGSQHGSEIGLATDLVRTQHLERIGFRVLRFWNHQVFTEIDAVLDTIHAALGTIDPILDPHLPEPAIVVGPPADTSEKPKTTQPAAISAKAPTILPREMPS